MKVTMLENVTPESYGLNGQAGWVESVQWEKGKTYDLDSHLADMFLTNGDAYNAEPFDMQDIVDAAAERAEIKQIVGNDNHKQPYQVMAEMFGIIFDSFEKRTPTNPATHQQIGEAL